MRSRGPVSADSTKAALLDAAALVFAQRGYYDSTVREIAARARANVAAVKYHFGDKLGLYKQVLRRTILRAGHDLIPAIVREHAPPEQILRKLVHAVIARMMGSDEPAQRLRLIAHEIARPTPALPSIVHEVIQPNYDRLRNIVGSILGLPPNDELTCLCALSVVAQITFYARAGPIFMRLHPQRRLTPTRVRRIADHITDFSLASMQRQP